MRVVLIPALRDNFMYLLICEETKLAAVVDPVAPDKVLKVAKAEGVKITHVLTTHSHWDHAGGNKEFVTKHGGPLEVLGGEGDGVPATTKTVKEGDKFKVGKSINVRVLYTPCHTPGHVCYFCVAADGSKPVCFTGDTMFVAGCGNFNAGTPAQMWDNFKRLGALPKETVLYVGHEYTVRNLSFAAFVEPENKRIAEKLAWAKKQRAQGAWTVPTTIADEWETNPFLRTGKPAVMKYTGEKDGPKAMYKVRSGKDEWGRSN